MVESEIKVLQKIARANLGIGGSIVTKTITFDGGTTDDIGDYDGEGNPGTLFTVTGDVLVRVFGVCSTNLTGSGATVEVGTSAGTALIIAQTTAENIDANEVWASNTPASAFAASSINTFVVSGSNIILTVGTANITAGVIKFYCCFEPLTAGATVEAA